MTTGRVERNGVTTVTLGSADGGPVAMVAERRDREVERHIVPALRRLGGRYAALEDALRRGAVPAAVARDLHRLLQEAGSQIGAARRDALRGRAR